MLEAPPPVPIKTIMRRRRLLRPLFEHVASGADLTAEHCWACCRAVRRSETFSHARETWKILQPVLDQHGVNIVGRVVTWLAGNWDAFDRHPLPWVDTPTATWASVEVLGVASCQDHGDGVEADVYVWSSIPAGQRLLVRIPRRMYESTPRVFGFTRQYPFDGEWRSLVGLYITMYMAPPRYGHVWQCWACAMPRGHLQQLNRAVLRGRYRFFKRVPDVEACPYGYDHDCQDCHQGAEACVSSYRRTVPA